MKSTDNLKDNRKNAVGSALTVTVMFLACGILFGSLSEFIEVSFSLSESSVQLIKCLSNIIAYVFSGIITCKIVSKSVNIKIKQAANFKKTDILSVTLSVLTIRSIQYLTMQLISLILSNKMSIEANENSDVTLLFIIEAAIAAPIIEEINFRYAFYELLLKKFDTKLTVIISSAVFALLHTYNIQGFFSIFILAVILSLIYLYTHNIYNIILCHILYNFTALIDTTSIKIFNLPIGTVKNGFLTYSSIWILIQTVILFLCFIYIKLFFIKKYSSKELIKSNTD